MSDTSQAAVTGRLADYVARSAKEALPQEIAELAVLHVLDTVAAIVACGDLEPAAAARRFALRHTGGLGAPILATARTASLTDAVFASAMTGHAAEINDFCPSAFVQPGPPVVSAALVLGDQRGLDGARLVAAVAAGYEIACRMPKALGTANLRRSGLANHGVGSTFGAAVTAAVALGQSAEQVEHLLSLTAQQASGSWQWMLDVDHIEKALVFAGMGARTGVQTALLVEAGFTGVPRAFDRAGGWASSIRSHGLASEPLTSLVEGLGERFELPLVGYKRYPVGGPAQPAVEALLSLSGEVTASEVRSVLIEMPGAVEAFARAGMPALNLPYLAAVILLDGTLGISSAQSRERMENDVTVRALMNVVEVRHDPAQEAAPRIESARLTVTTADGAIRTTFVEHVKGFPAHPMSRADVVAKADELLAPHLGASRARDLRDLVLALESLDDVGAVVEAMRVEGR